MPVLKIATRESPLALWQAEHVQALLLQAHPDLAVELLPMTTLGDQRLEGSAHRPMLPRQGRVRRQLPLVREQGRVRGCTAGLAHTLPFLCQQRQAYNRQGKS